MILREAVALTWILLSALNILFSGTLLGWLVERHHATCERHNVEFLQQGYQGPIKPC